MSYHDYIPEDLMQLYEVYDYKHAAAILANEFPEEFKEVCDALREFRITQKNITDKGGNESQIPKSLSNILRPAWKEGKLKAQLVVDEVPVNIETHKIDYVKGRVALDMEWNSKDQTFDRDLYAFRAFFDYNKISVGVLITRSIEINSVFAALGVKDKYGASTTQMGKLLPRLDSGRNGGCPILVFGITSKIVEGFENDKVEIQHPPETVTPYKDINITELKNMMED